MSFIRRVQSNNKCNPTRLQKAYRNNGLKTRMVSLPPIRPQTIEQANMAPDNPAAPFAVVAQAMDSVARRMEMLLLEHDMKKDLLQ